MASSDTEKLRKAQVLAVAVRSLRERLGFSQEALASAVGGDTNVGSISRWERAQFSPGPAKRRRLAAIARKHGMGDLIAAFEQPAYEWKAALLSSRHRDWCALFEIIMLNAPLHDDGISRVISHRAYARLLTAFRAVVRELKHSHDYYVRVRAKSGPGILPSNLHMVTDEQVAAWQAQTGGFKAKAKKEPEIDRPGVILYHSDGHIEMYRDDAECSKVLRRRAREDRDEGTMGDKLNASPQT